MKSILLAFIQAVLLVIHLICEKQEVEVENKIYKLQEGYNGKEWLEQINFKAEAEEIKSFDEKQIGKQNELLFYYNEFSQIYLQNNQQLNQYLKPDQKSRIQQFYTITKQVNCFEFQNSMQRLQ